MPTFPPLVTRIRSVLFVFVTKSMASVVPIKFVEAEVPELPVKLQFTGEEFCHVKPEPL